MLYPDKDPSFQTYLLQEALKQRGLYTGELDNWRGPRTEDALAAAAAQIRASVVQSPATLPNRFRDLNAAGVELIKSFEGLFLDAYQDSVGIWTIGWGHTGLKHNDGTVKKGRRITLQEAEELLRYDMDVFEGRVTRLVTAPLSDNEYSALVSFDFNTGGLADSKLLRLLNAGDRAGAADQFLRWDKAGGKTLTGLTRRRNSERNLFLSQLPYILAA